MRGGESRKRGRERWSIGNGREKKEEEVQEDRGKEEEEGDEGAEGGKKKWEEAETRWLRRGRREGTPGGGMC